MNYTRKHRQRGGGGKTSKPVATTQTPAAALQEQVGKVVSVAAQLRASHKAINDLRREKESLNRTISNLRSTIATRKSMKHSSRNIIKAKEDELTAAINRLSQVKELLGEKEEAVESAAGALGHAAAAIEGIGEHGEHVLGRRVEAAEAASAAANRAARNVEYAGLSNSARKRLHNADRLATNLAKPRDLAKLVAKYKKTMKKLKRLSKAPLSASAANNISDQADFLRRLASELLERIGRENKNTGAYLNAAMYSPKSASPISPNSA